MKPRNIKSQLKKKAASQENAAATAVGLAFSGRPRLTTWAELVANIVAAQGQQRVTLAASGAGFWVIIAIYPAAIAAINIFGLVVAPDKVAAALGDITKSGPGSLGEAFGTQLEQIAQSDQTTLSIGLAVSLAISIWGASAGTYNTARAIRLSRAMPPQNYFTARFESVVAGIFGIIAVCIIAFLSSWVVVQFDQLSGFWKGVAVLAIGIPVVVGLLTIFIVGLYKYALGRKTPFRVLWPGALLASVSTLIMMVGFGIYIDHFANYTAVYGAVAGIVISMLLSYAAIYIVLIAAILNAEIERIKVESKAVKAKAAQQVKASDDSGGGQNQHDGSQNDGNGYHSEV